MKYDCFVPEEGHEYPLCVGILKLDGTLEDKCTRCCFYTDFDLYNNPHPEECMYKVNSDGTCTRII